MRGHTARVFRAPERDRHGDPVDAQGNPVDMLDDEGNAFVGVVSSVVLGGLSASPSMKGQESGSSRGMIGLPKKASVRVTFGDRVEINGVRYQVISRPEWDYRHGLTGTDFGYYWVDVEGVYG